MNCAEKILYHALKGVRESAGVLATVSMVTFGSGKCCEVRWNAPSVMFTYT
jgi:hypothetical protein